MKDSLLDSVTGGDEPEISIQRHHATSSETHASAICWPSSRIVRRSAQTARSPHPCAKPRPIRPRNAQPRSQRQHSTSHTHTHATLYPGGGAHPLSLMQWDRSRPMYDPTTPESLTCMPLSSHGPSCPLHAPLAPDAHTHAPPHERGLKPSRAAGASGHIRIS